MPFFRWIPTGAQGKLAVLPCPSPHEIPDLAKAGVDLLVSMLGDEESAALGLANESALCATNKIGFLCVPIVDRSTPSDGLQIHEAAQRISDGLELGQNVAIHCRMGIGRSALMAACVLVLRRVPVEEAFSRISVARGVEVPDTLEQFFWVQEFDSKLRLE